MSVSYSARSVVVMQGSEAAVFTVQRSGTTDNLARQSTVEYATADVTARAGEDYTATAGALSFAPGETARPVEVAILREPSPGEAVRSFLFTLRGYGAATGSISGEHGNSDTQIYWIVPGHGDNVAVPTGDAANPLARAQMDVAKFSDPADPDKRGAVPHSYLRLGHARADMNVAERLIAQSRDFFATSTDGDGNVVVDADGVPVEPGATLEFMKPRNINREDPAWRDEKAGNRHLDGIFSYTEGNMTSSTLGSATYVTKGDCSVYVGGEARQTYMDDVTTAFLSPTDGIFRYAQGAQNIGGEYIDYEIKGLRSLEVAMEDSVRYATSNEFAVNTAAQIDVFTGTKYEVTNAARFEVAGLELSAKCDLLGNYEIDFMAGESSTTRSENSLTATEQIVLQVDPAGGVARRAAVAGFVGTNMAAAAAAAITAAVPFGSSQDGLANSFASSVEMKTSFANLMNAGYPDTFRVLAGIGATMLILMAAAQKIADIVPLMTPKISMNPLELSLSVGATSIKLTNAGIVVMSPSVDWTNVGPFDVRTANFNLTAGVMNTQTAPQNKFIGLTTVSGNFAASGNIVSLFGNVLADNILAGV